MRNKEYDRFGPWILEISEDDPVPSLFESKMPNRAEDPLLSIKIPRKIDRINAKPGMQLYDYVITMFEEDIVILKRENNHILKETISYKEIISIQLDEILLNGKITLFLSRGDYCIPYSTASKNIVYKLIDIIKSKYTSAEESSKLAILDISKQDNLGFRFSGMLKDELKNNSALQLCAYQIKEPVTRPGKELFGRLIGQKTNKNILEAIHLFTGKEMKIITREKNIEKKKWPSYGKSTFYIPTKNIKQIIWREDFLGFELTHLEIVTRGKIHNFCFSEDNKMLYSYKKILNQLKGKY